MSNDQRNNMRLPRACRVTVEITSICPHGTGPSERLSCTTRDLSRSGVNLRLPLELSPGAIPGPRYRHDCLGTPAGGA
jgi:hypothetical protein